MPTPTRVADRYIPLRLLGEGGAGRVWLVEDRLRPGAYCALKELTSGGADREAAFRREYATLSQLKHPSLVEAWEFDVAPESGLPRFTLEFVEGDNAVAAVRSEGIETFFTVATEALRALAFLHDVGLVHRDVTPANLLVRRKPRAGCRVVLLDFGLAASSAGETVVSHKPAGTLPYLAPEIFEGSSPGRRTDLYSLGAVLFEALHGRPPFATDGLDLAAFLRAVSTGKRAHPAAPPGYPRGLHGWIEELLSPDPAGRPAEAEEALARLNAACGTRYPVETAAIRSARLASGEPPGRSASIAELSRLVTGVDGPRLVWLAGGSGSGKSRVLRWLGSQRLVDGWEVVAPGPGEAGDLVDRLDELRARASAHPVLVLLDDAEAAGTRLATFLERVAREGRAAPLKVVAAVRTGRILHPAVRRLLRDTPEVPTLALLTLEPLALDEVRTVAERAGGQHPVSESRVRALLEASEGNPRVLELLLVEGKRALPAASGLTGALGEASEEARRILRALAVLGEGALEADVAALSELPPPAARESLAELSALGLVQSAGGRWSCEARELRREILGALDAALCQELHQRAAEILETAPVGQRDDWRLARLWREGGDFSRAVESAREAAKEAASKGDPAEAAERVAFAARLLSPADPSRRTLRLEQGDLLVEAGLFTLAERPYQGALRLSRGPALLAESLGRLAHARVLAGDFDGARSAAEQALEIGREHGLVLESARARKALGIVFARLGSHHEAELLLNEALAAFEHLASDRDSAETLHALASCRAASGATGAAALFERALDRMRDTTCPASLRIKSLVGLAVERVREGRHEDGEALLEEARRDAAAHGSLSLLPFVLARLSAIAYDRGRFDRAIRLAEESRDQALWLAEPQAVLASACRIAEALVACGRPAEAADRMREALGEAPERVEPLTLHYARMTLAQALMESPSSDEAQIRSLLQGSLEGCRKLMARRALLMGLVLEMERRARAVCADAFEEVSEEFDAVAARAAREPETELRLRAAVARASWRLKQGRFAEAVASAREATELARLSAPAFAAGVSALLHRALQAASDTEGAEEARRQGRQLLDEAAQMILDPEIRRDFQSRSLFRVLCENGLQSAGHDNRRLVALYDMIRALNSESDPDALLQTILDMAVEAVGAERGMVLLLGADGASFSVRLARNLEKETEHDAESFSHSIVAEAGSGRSVLALAADQDVRFRDLKSVSLYGIRSLMCVPLRSRGRIVGTVYLDNRREGALFTPEDLRFVEAFADHAALALENVRARADLERENRRLQAVAETRVSCGNIVGRCAAMQKVFDWIEKITRSELPVLIEGESGTGKELVAKAIHFHGPRSKKVFLSENCAAIPESLLESELFGHVKGAFTGADRDRAGLFEQAHRGTLFLDEVGDMSPAMQARLLRALQEKEVRRVGGDKPIPVDVRVVAATHRDLAREVSAGRFREDLLYRLQVLVISLPPLRERPGDLPILAAHLLDRISCERGRPAPRLGREVLDLLERYPWPGNVRQLENALQRLALLAGDGPITRETIEADAGLRQMLLADALHAEPTFSLERNEREQIRRALEAASGNRERAARLLGISRATIYRKVREHGLS